MINEKQKLSLFQVISMTLKKNVLKTTKTEAMKDGYFSVKIFNQTLSRHIPD